MTFLLIPYNNEVAMKDGHHPHASQGKRINRTKQNQRRFKSIAVKCLAAYLTFVLATNVVFEDTRLRRSLACRRKRNSALSRRMTLEESGYNDSHNSFLANLYDPMRYLVEDPGDDCNIIYPGEVVQTTGSDSYYTPFDPDSGLYYPGENEEIPLAEIADITNPEGEVDPAVLVPDVDEPMYYSEVDTALLSLFEPQIYEPVNETVRPGEGTTAYTVTITSCPGTYDPPASEVTDPGADLYEASAICKNNVCNTTDTTATARRLGSHGHRDLVEADYTMYAIVHPDAVNCPNPDGTTYNRVKLLQTQGYYVEILGQPITSTDLEETQPYINAHIEEDVGIRDSITLHAFSFEGHNAVVVLDYNTQLQAPLDDEINDLVSDPTKQVKYVRDKDGGVSKGGFMIIKPSIAKFEEIRQEYINTPYDPVTGWNGEGHNTFNGKMGLKGFFSYKASKDPSWEELDRCTYNNQLDDYCISQIDVDNSKVVRHSKSVCGEPRDCPYDHPKWSETKKVQCRKSHENYFRSRDEFEQKYLIKRKIQEPVGIFKQDAFMGYCKGPGKKNYLGFTKAIYEKPDWQVLCDRTTCPPGTYKKNDCTCTTPEDPCAACPTNTQCQIFPELRCIDCNCGFCDEVGVSCCTFNGVNNCKAGPGDEAECIMQKNFYPAFGGEGNVCSGVEISDTATPNGCGCQPNETTPCTYNPDLQDKYDDRCYICTTDDLINGICPTCTECLETCDPCIGNLFSTPQETKNCLKRMSDECRATCANSCKKNL